MKQKMDGTNQMEIRQWSARRRIRTISERLQKLIGIHVIEILYMYVYGIIMALYTCSSVSLKSLDLVDLLLLFMKIKV